LLEEHQAAQHVAHEADEAQERRQDGRVHYGEPQGLLS
jgi:hypothetical protein